MLDDHIWEGTLYTPQSLRDRINNRGVEIPKRTVNPIVGADSLTDNTTEGSNKGKTERTNEGLSGL